METVFLALVGGFLSMDHQESPSACLSEGFAQNLSRQAPCTSKRRLKLVLPGCQCFDIRCVSVAATVFAPEDALEEGDPVGWKPSELRMRLCPLGFGGPCANLQNLGQHSTQPINAPAGPTDTCTQACLQLRCHHALAFGLAPLVFFTHTEAHSRHLFKKHLRLPWW